MKFEVEFYEKENGDQPAKEFILLRIKSSSNISRIMYFFYVDQHIILTNGFIKKTKKTARSEIEKAKNYRRDYLDRNGGSYEHKI